MFSRINPLQKPTAAVEMLIMLAVAFVLGYITHWVLSMLSKEGGVVDEEEVVFEPDDLKLIEGIGPKIETLLNERGIHTFEELAASNKSDLKSVLDEAGSRYRMHNPATWIKQAALARDGDWNALQKLQSRLRAGKE